MLGGIGSTIRLTTASTSTGPPCASASAMPFSTSPGSSSRMPRTPTASAIAEKSRRFLLDLNKAERAVVEDDDLDRQVVLHQRQEVAHQHRESAVARERDH